MPECRSNYFADTDQLHQERGGSRIIRCGLPAFHGGDVHAEMDEDGTEVCTWPRKAEPRRTWSLPAEPGPEVTRVKDRDGTDWIRDRGAWQVPGDNGLSRYAWFSLLMLAGPLTDATPTQTPEESA